ncbi:MAG: DNA/RNA nuclease SfsA [Clostridia bacterium]|nr:DNA/RNA nuclease SfsA [Clostridia bacterium]
MKYKERIVKGVFISRPNRFIANVEIDGKTEVAHVKNTGRCRELLVSGATVYLTVAENPERKTKFDLVAVEKATQGGIILINMDSQAVNNIAEEYLRKIFPRADIRREVTYKSSRFDFYLEENGKGAFCEVKGVTLEKDGVASFPDAPTERGVKHLRELTEAKNEGYDAYVLFVVQMENVSYLTPNDITHKEFGDTLRLSKASGVEIMAVSCIVEPSSVLPHKEVKIRL